ncbi:MAG: endolytic transglycosylase MltG [Hydrogenoanaerobacterium sp.]
MKDNENTHNNSSERERGKYPPPPPGVPSTPPPHHSAQQRGSIRRPTPPHEQMQHQDYDKPKARRQKPKKQYRVVRALIITIILVGLCGFMAYFALESASDLLGLSFDVVGVVQNDKQVTVKIPQGASTGDIAKILNESGIINTPVTFKLYSKFKKADGKYQFGEYILNCKMSYDQIISALKSGNKREDIVTVSFPEGLSLWEIGKKLEENDVCTAKEFVEALQTGTYEFDFMKGIPIDNPLRFYKYEGYVFPDTYNFFVSENPNSVAKKFFNSFNKNVTTDLYDRMKKMDMTLDETITLASIIQKEASLPEDMNAVSGVFHNRFAKTDVYPQMQSDVTIFYIEKFIKPHISIANQAMYDAYNTYVCSGLPVGPVCSPGIDAIRAALYPDQSEYYYFLTDLKGNFYYAKTMEEHEQNIRAADKVNAEVKSEVKAEVKAE